MTLFLGICCLTTAIAIASVFSTGHASLRKRLLPWVGGLLVGIGAFWILPEMADERGWTRSLIGVFLLLLLLAGIDRYIYPICPFCAAGVHTDAGTGCTRAGRHTVTPGWPLLIAGCIHCFFDGWTIALSQAGLPAAAALSWGFVVHKFPESVAIGILAARLTVNRTLALWAVLLVQGAMAAGGILAFLVAHLEPRWTDLYSMPACALLMLLGLLALQEEWRSQGSRSAIRAALPGLVACGLVAIAGHVLSG